ncbi:FAD dependent oxidoreductase family protein [Burkholderia thailandensis]|nr:FAD dependent oxidoreductase family protein [Burkholderia thailandensis]
MTQKSPANGRDSNHFDVIILGSGMSGTQMGAILGKQQFRVLIIEESSHPRFTIGESSIPETSLMNRIIADRYGIPELDHITSFYATQRYVASSTGIKRNFGFVFHKPGREHDPKEFTQCVIPELPWGPESHYFRQDVDAYLLQAAIKYGCTVRQKTNVTEYHADKDGVAVTTAQGERFTGRYMIDCGGPARRSRPSSSSAKSRVASRRTRAASTRTCSESSRSTTSSRSRGSAGAGTRGLCTTCSRAAGSG